MTKEETILEAAVAQGLPWLDVESANAQVVKLLRQIGELENLNAALESGGPVIPAGKVLIEKAVLLNVLASCNFALRQGLEKGVVKEVIEVAYGELRVLQAFCQA